MSLEAYVKNIRLSESIEPVCRQPKRLLGNDGFSLLFSQIDIALGHLYVTCMTALCHLSAWMLSLGTSLSC